MLKIYGIKEGNVNISKWHELNYKELVLSDDQNQGLLQISEELKLDNAIESLKLDPYWPKWDSPWWKAILLYDAGYKHLIPIAFLKNLIRVIDDHYLHHFPLVAAEMPKDCDPYRQILCFCGLGNMYKVLEGCGFNVQAELPWWYDWLGRYQLPDGGYNCDESAYTSSRKSSFQSTLPMLEAMLLVYQKTGNKQVKSLLDKGAEYLLKHEVYKSSVGKIIDEEWFQLSFPNYYDYDLLRGFSFLVEWADPSFTQLPKTLVDDCLQKIGKSLNANGCVIIGRNKILSEGSLFYEGSNWTWSDKSQLFPTLELFSRAGDVSVPLSLKWQRIIKKLAEF